MYFKFIIVKNKKYIFKIECTICSYLIDFQRKNFLENVFDCLFFNQKRGENRKVRSFFEMFGERKQVFVAVKQA
jgi:hypothetical protein